ncbi:MULTISPECIES: FAD-binding oxidoreductase [Enterococcus]|uniref:FAD-binding PCMH-type domain-containing protein n=1 Tax=Candidatus Enterococcus ferrettii TaxID=2815324 RepID=A0ABV0ER58_9ENTE|nr:FAD-dependent oxidoreductase [Enterococcus sp. 665A]MBO1339852.1 FAD-dependent oxidoreductase [Enterococcus sp. 665A]
MEKALPELPASLKNVAVFPEDSRYDKVRSNDYKVGHPKVVILAETEEQVIDAVNYAAKINQEQQMNFPLSIKSGGHGLSATSVNDEGMVLDLSQMNQITIIDEEKRLVKIQAGALWGDVAQKLTPHHLVISSGDHGDTGVGGLAVSGGMGILLRSFGLTIDKVAGATIITADGKKHWVDNENEPELFWGIRGGGGQLGVVTEFLFHADKAVPTDSGFSVPIVVQTVDYSIDHLPAFIEAWHQWFDTSSTKLTSILLLNAGDDDTIVAQGRNFWYGDDSSQSREVFEKANKLGEVLEENQKSMEYSDFVRAQHTPLEGKNTAYGRNILVKHISENVAKEIQYLLDKPFVYGVELRSLGGAVNQPTSYFNAWSYRQEEIMIAYWFDKNYAEEANNLFQPFLQFGTGIYGAYSSDESSTETHHVWKGEAAEKLRALNKRYDPNQLFTQNRKL